MSITTSVPKSFLSGLMQAQHDFTSDTFKIALYGATANLDDTVTAYTSAGEISAGGYTAGGLTLSGVRINAASGHISIDAAAASWTGTFTIAGYMIYNASKANAAVAIQANSQTGVVNLSIALTAFLNLFFPSTGGVYVTDSWLQELFNGIHNMGTVGSYGVGDILKIALFTDSVSFGPGITNYSSTGEVVSPAFGYAAGGASFIGFGGVQSQMMSFSGSTLIWQINTTISTSGIWVNPWPPGPGLLASGDMTARWALIYNTSKANRSVLIFDFGGNISARGPGGDLYPTFPIATMFPADGLIRLSYGTSVIPPVASRPSYSEFVSTSSTCTNGVNSICFDGTVTATCTCACSNICLKGQCGCGHTLVYSGSRSTGTAAFAMYSFPTGPAPPSDTLQIEMQCTVNISASFGISMQASYTGGSGKITGTNFPTGAYSTRIWPDAAAALPVLNTIFISIGLTDTINGNGQTTIDVTDVRLLLIRRLGGSAPGTFLLAGAAVGAGRRPWIAYVT